MLRLWLVGRLALNAVKPNISRPHVLGIGLNTNLPPINLL